MHKMIQLLQQMSTLLVIMSIWHKLYLHYSAQQEQGNKTLIHIQRLREILTFVHENYDANISLDEIAEYTSLSKSECCRFFKNTWL